MNLQLEHPSYGVSGAAGAPSPLPPYHHVHPHHAHTPSPPPLLFRSHDYESHRYHNHKNCYSMDTFHPHHAHQHAQYYPRVEQTQQEQSRTITPVHVESSSTTKQEEGNANNSSILIREEKEKDHNENKNNVLVPTADESRESRRQRIQKMVDNKRGLYQRRMNTYITSSSQNNATGNANTNAVTNSHYYYLMSPEATASAVSAALDISPSQIHDEDVANIAFGLVKNLAQANVQQAQKAQAQQAEEKKTSTSAKAKATEDKPKGKGKARGRSRSIARKKNTKSSKETKAKENQDTTKATTATSTKKKKKESVHDMELPEGNDPESRKMRRLIRNRLSAQLHRERKREALDSLRAEVEERDEKIKVLEQELKEERLKISTMESEMDCVKNYYGYDVIHAVIKGHHHHTLLRKHQPSSSPELVSTGSSSSSSSDEESTLSPPSPQRSLDSDTEIMTGLLVDEEDDEEVGAAGQPKRKRKRFTNHNSSNNNRRSGNATVFMLGSMALCGFIAFFNAFTSPDYYYAGYNGAEHGNLYQGVGDPSTSSPSSTSRSVWNLLGCLWNDYDTNVLGPEFHHPSAAPHVRFIPHYNNKNMPQGETFRSRLLNMVTAQFFSPVSNMDNTNNDSKKKEGRSLLMNKNSNNNYHFISPVESEPRKWNLSHGTPWVAERENPLYNAMKSKLMKQNNNKNDSSSSLSSTSKMMNPVSFFLKSYDDEKKTSSSSSTPSHDSSSSFVFSPYAFASLSTELEDLVANEAAFRSGFDLEDLEDVEVSSMHKDLFIKNDSISPQYLSFLLPASRLAPGYFYDDYQEWVELGMEVKSARILENVDFLSMEEDVVVQEEESSNVGSGSGGD